MWQFRADARHQVRTTAYAALDAAFLGRGVPRTVNGQRLRLPAPWCRYYPGVYEPAKHRHLVESCSPGTTVIDGGAHIGLFTVAMARAVGPNGCVLAFEPTPGTRAILTRTVALNDIGATVCIRPEALSRRTGTATLQVGPTEGANANSLIGSAASGSSQVEVAGLALDDLLPSLASPVSCIKLDIEGAELDTLLGARTLLERFHPALCIEVHPRMLRVAGQAPTQVKDLLSELGYDLFEGSRDCPDERFSQDGMFEFQAAHRSAPRVTGGSGP